jgi:hypothetical protein
MYCCWLLAALLKEHERVKKYMKLSVELDSSGMKTCAPGQLQELAQADGGQCFLTTIKLKWGFGTKDEGPLSTPLST